MSHSRRSLFRGRIITLTNGSTTAEITSVGAALNRFSIDGRDFILTSPTDQPMIGYRGAIVAPWPNRIGDGRYEFDGTEYLVPITEHERRTALHGLVSFADFAVAHYSQTEVKLVLRVTPTLGYPFPLDLTVEYQLEDGRISTTVTAMNLGDCAAPYGVCPHPYLVPGKEPLNSWKATVPASHVLDVDERLLPTELTPTSQRPELALEGEEIGQKEIDHAYTGFEQGRITVESDSGRVWMEFDPSTLPWAQIHTADNSNPELNRTGLAVEPMTCPPDAFRTGQDLVRIEAGESHTVQWILGAEIIE